MNLQLTTNLPQLLEKLQQTNQAWPPARLNATKQIATQVLEQTAALNPVDTGRSQAAWQAAAESIQQGGPNELATSGEGSSSILDENTRTQIHSSNHVPYVPFLEYGTTRMQAFAMLRQSLTQSRPEAKSILQQALNLTLNSGN